MTPSGFRQVTRNLTAYLLVACVGLPARATAQTHVVSPGELQSAVVSASLARQQNREAIARLFSAPGAAKALQAAQVDLKQVNAAISALSDEEAARLAARSAKVQADFAAGRITERDLLIILIGIAALILIIVAVR
jgi:hypothetical protein